MTASPAEGFARRTSLLARIALAALALWIVVAGVLTVQQAATASDARSAAAEARTTVESARSSAETAAAEYREAAHDEAAARVEFESTYTPESGAAFDTAGFVLEREAREFEAAGSALASAESESRAADRLEWSSAMALHSTAWGTIAVLAFLAIAALVTRLFAGLARAI